MSYRIRKYADKKNFIVEYNHRQGLLIQDGAELVEGVYTEFTYALLPNEIMTEELAEVEVSDLNEEGYEIGTHMETYILRYPIINPNYEAEQAQKEAERIAMLYLTAADVERGIYKAKGMDFDDILNLVSAYPQEGLDIKALKIELKANHFYRANPYVSAVGALLGFTEEQLNKFFEDGNYEHLLDVNNSEQAEEENPVVEDIPDVENVINLEDEVDNE